MEREKKRDRERVFAEKISRLPKSTLQALGLTLSIMIADHYPEPATPSVAESLSDLDHQG